MPKIKKFNDESIYLIDTLILVWEGKWKIFGAIIVSIIFTFFYLNPLNQKKIFTANTKIDPISSSEEFKFTSINMIKSIAYLNQKESNLDKMEADIHNEINLIKPTPKITKHLLFDRYVEILEERTVIAPVSAFTVSIL